MNAVEYPEIQFLSGRRFKGAFFLAPVANPERPPGVVMQYQTLGPAHSHRRPQNFSWFKNNLVQGPDRHQVKGLNLEEGIQHD